jgi:O-antigen/teichoic acid export membrane protein
MPSNTTRIAKNTLMLYFRQILIMLVSLYTVRVVLETLGAEEYGIYNVVAGVVTMFGFLSNSMATATQRYLSFELGRNDFEQSKRVFSLSITIYVLIGITILLLAEIFGLWFVNHKLVIPVNRLGAARWIYQFAILSLMFTMITTPYMASVIAHEDMRVYAYVSIVEVFLKLVIVFCLRLFPIDKLVLYGVLMFAAIFINTGIYRFICTRKYDECRFRFYWNYALFKELTSYIGWNLFGQLSKIGKAQGINILLNIYFGPMVNTARAIATRVDSAVISFAQNFTVAVRPQIVKFYATDNKSEMIALIFQSSKTTFFLLFLFILPLQLELPYILKIWLKQIPEYVLSFTRIILLDALINSIGYPLTGASQATGDIKLFQVIVEGIQLFNLPFALIGLVLGFSPDSVLIVGVLLSLCSCFAEILIISKQLRFPLRQYFKNVLFPIILVLITGSIIPIVFVLVYHGEVLKIFLTIIFCTVSILLSVYFIGFSVNERLFVKNLVIKYIKRVI